MTRAAAKLRGFAPVARADARLLILGSMPGVASLDARQYYAHPRNAFWPILEAVWGIPASLPYAQRLREVCARRIAIWDVLASCRRRTSLDSHIEPGSIVANDLPGFFRRHRHIVHVAFNGGGAELLYRRHVLPLLPAGMQHPCSRLPSTSPAHAGLPLQAKVRAWRSLHRYTDAA